ncbi:hypothetical protein [Mesorhizobium sp. CN2-181]|uniref:hypothetical protein n=1 Tax=Mesorhizobium yinganensis TaxID=3157707 RepID=UPI0032B84EB6
MTEAEPRTAKPASLLSQWWSVGTILTDRRTTGRHGKVAWVIIERFMQKHGRGRASVRFIEAATGLSKGIIIKACRELVEWGYFQQIIGEGTRPSEYIPSWASVSPLSNSKAIVASVPQESNTSVPHDSNASEISVPPMCNESYLPEPAERHGVKVSRNENTLGAPSAPLSACLSAADAETPRDPFEKFWSAYPRKYQKPKAKTAWAKVAPDADKAERIIIAAGAWADHYTANPVEKKWIPAPANWLAGERYDEDIPEVYVDPKQAAIAKKKDRPAKARPKAYTKPTDGVVYPRRESVTISNAYLDDYDGTKWLHLDLTEDDGKNHEFTVTIESLNEDEQMKGQRTLRRICEAAGIDAPDDTSELIGKSFVRVMPSKFAPDFEYEPPPSAAAVQRAFWGPDLDYEWKPPVKPPRPPMPRFLDRVRMSPFSKDEADTAARAKAYAAGCAEQEEAAA